MGFFDFMTQEIAIDLGTANTLIIHNDKVVVDEPSIGLEPYGAQNSFALNSVLLATATNSPSVSFKASANAFAIEPVPNIPHLIIFIFLPFEVVSTGPCAFLNL